jgi:hypothetical protein
MSKEDILISDEEQFSEGTTIQSPGKPNQTVPQAKPVQHFQSSPDFRQTSGDGGATQTDDAMPKDPFIIELCAGSARVTSCLQQLGMPASFGVDHVKQQNSGRVLIADLTTKAGKDLCWTWLKSTNCVGVFIAPPCGTCSRARGIPIKLPNGFLIAGPQPLRTEGQPNGVTGLSYVNKLRVSQANAIYHFVTEVALFCHDRNLLVCIENPRSSLYWRTTFFAPLAKKLKFTAHQACAYGSSRPKWTVLAHNTKSLLQLNRVCPGVSADHVHKPWGVVSGPDGRKFSTAEETAYPLPLAYHIAYYLAQELILKGWRPPSDAFSPPDEVSYQYLRSIIGVQHKASKIAPLVSEFLHVISIHVPNNSHIPILPGEKLQTAWRGVPLGSCLLKRPPLRLRWGNGENNPNSPSNNVLPNNLPNNVSPISPSVNNPLSNVLHFGVYRSGAQFAAAAASAGHPAGGEARLPSALREAIRFVSSRPMHEVPQHRLRTLKFWLARGKELAKSEEELHVSLHPSIKDILAPKRLLLWKEMLEHYQYPDLEVFDEVVSGVCLSGTAPTVPFFEPSFKPAKITEGELAASARASRVALLASVRSSGDLEIDNEVFSKTMDEVACGWLEGPLELSSLGDDAVISRRFGIRQTSGEVVKIRLIDDFTASNVNQVDNSPKLHTLDIVAALCMELLKLPGQGAWVGKTIDLSSAYRQLGISPSSRWVSYIAVYDPSSGSAKVFSMRALPFGASRSVYAFLRVAHSLWWLGCTAMKFLWSSFFDDFITMSRKSEADAMSIASSQFFRLLGWLVSSGEKDLPFSEVFKALGVEIDCSDWHSGLVKFRNTSKRIEELSGTISSALKRGRLGSHEALVLRGRMQFARAQIWGRAPKLYLSAITAHAYSENGGNLSNHAIACLRAFLDSLVAARPREITAQWSLPSLLFTDACFNPDDPEWPCGLGGVLCDAAGKQIAALSVSLTLEDLHILGYPEKSTVIFEAELLALVLCVRLWRKLIQNRPCVMYVDNNGTRDVAISGSARTFPGSSLVATLLSQEDAACVTAWYARVPSQSNIADPPSRNSSEGIEVGFVNVSLVRLHLDKLLGEVVKSGQSGEK